MLVCWHQEVSIIFALTDSSKSEATMVSVVVVNPSSGVNVTMLPETDALTPSETLAK